jgi:uncharacterized protein YegL
MISITQSYHSSSNSVLLKVSNTFESINIKKRLVILIDVSGSMQGERINLVLHAVKVIISASNENIEISIFTFDSVVKKIKSFTKMNDRNKLQTLEEIPNIPLTFGSTNLLDGINEPLKYIESVNDPNIDTHILVFTDGEPNIKDLSKYTEILDKYYKDSQLQNVIIDVFGFGKSLNQSIMTTIFQKGKGIFGFISDPNMLGTVFNNYIANLFSVCVKNFILSYEIEDSNRYEYIELGDLIAQQERHIILSGKSIGFASLSYTDLLTGGRVTLRYESIPLIEESHLKFSFHELRNKLYSVMERLNIRELESLYREYSLKLSDSSPTSSDYQKLKSLLDDMIYEDPNKGQIEKALANNHTWGKYYLMSLVQAHKNELTINFKDESIQSYSGPIASEMALQLNQIFASIPLILTYGQYESRYGYQSQSTYSASSYISQSTGCFIGTSKIQVCRNNILEYIKLEDLSSGDILYRNNSNLIVKHILKSQVKSGQYLYKYFNLIGTGNHPVLIDNNWYYMKDIGAKYLINSNSNIDFVYSISVYDTLNNKYIDHFIIENIACATFGHGYLDDLEDTSNILRSTFWGKTIIEIFERINSNDNVLTLYIDKYHFMRDLGTGWIYDLFIEE